MRFRPILIAASMFLLFSSTLFAQANSRRLCGNAQRRCLHRPVLRQWGSKPSGNEAILAWHVQDGAWNGVSLEGLTIAAAVHAKLTLGDPYATPYPAQAVLLVDDQASAEQQAALVAFAKHMGESC